jgi:hypothetical protein
MNEEIRVSYLAVDGYRKTSTFKTLAGAQRFAQKWVGATPELGSFYAVSPDGVGRVTCSGVNLSELFPQLSDAEPDCTACRHPHKPDCGHACYPDRDC